MRIRTMYNRTDEDRSFSFNNELSMTVPNQSYTIQELFERHKRNLPLPVEDIMPYFDNLDLDAAYINPLPGEEFVEYYNRLSDMEKSTILDNLSQEIRCNDSNSVSTNSAAERKTESNERSGVE